MTDKPSRPPRRQFTPEELEAANAELNGWSDVDDESNGWHVDGSDELRPAVELPGGAVTITSAAERLGELLGATGDHYQRGGVSVRLALVEGRPELKPHRPAGLCSDFEGVARLVRVTQTKNGPIISPMTCPKAAAEVIHAAEAFRLQLPEIRVVTHCPVLIDRDGELVAVSGYDRESGILAAGPPALDVELPEAVKLLGRVVREFNFNTDGDKARALSALVTPALVFGGLLEARAPIDLSEADESQAGKGYRNKLTCAVYNTIPKAVTQRTSGGVGSIQESFDKRLSEGAAFIPLDNFRGLMNLSWLESFLTEPSYPARVPYSSPMDIDPSRVIVQITSNSAELTPDLANRCAAVRIKKHPPNFEFKTDYPGGLDILGDVVARQPLYLGAVFSVIREWHRLGKPLLDVSGHDFRRWARVLGWISKNILGAGELLAGHREALDRMAHPGRTWLRELALAVIRSDDGDHIGRGLRVHEILSILVAAGKETEPEGDAAWEVAIRRIGAKLAQQFTSASAGKITIEGVLVERRPAVDDQQRHRNEYAFFPVTPKAPEGAPK